MRHLSTTLITLALTAPAQADVLADWDFSSLVNPMVNNAPTVNPLIPGADANAAAGLSASDLTAEMGSPTFQGLLWANVNVVNGAMNHKYWDGDLSDLGGTANDGVSDNWIAFTLTNNAGGSVLVERLSVSIWRNGAGAAGTYAFQVVVDGGTPQAFGASQDDPNSADFGYDWFDFDDSLTFNSTLEVRFQPVATPGGQGTGNLHINGLRVESGGTGSNYCISTVNSTGAPSVISATGSTSISANALVLTANNLPAQPGIFIAGPTSGQTPFYNGFLCIDPVGLQRFASIANPTSGLITEAVDYATSAPGGLNVMAGASYFYQRWNRDPAGGGGNANFSDGLEIVHTP